MSVSVLGLGGGGKQIGKITIRGLFRAREIKRERKRERERERER